MSFKLSGIAFASVTAFAIAHGALAQETGGIPLPDQPFSYDRPPSNGGGGGRPGLRLGTGTDIQFGGPRDTFVLPESQTLYRADDQIAFVEEPFEFPVSADVGESPDEDTEPEPEEDWRNLPGAPNWPPDGSPEWLAYFGIDEESLLPPSTGGGGGRPGTFAGFEDEEPEEFGYLENEPRDYIEDCDHPWHGACGPRPTWPKPFTEEELRRIGEHAANQPASQEGADRHPALEYDTPSFDGFHPSPVTGPFFDVD